MPKFKSVLVFPDNTTQTSAVTSLNSLTDVIVTSPALGQTIAYNGTNWVNATNDVNALATSFDGGTEEDRVLHAEIIDGDTLTLIDGGTA